MLELIKGANLLLRFLLELFALGALGYWGFKTGGGTAAKVGLGIGAPLVAAIVWGVFLSPRAAVALQATLVLVLQAVVFGAAAASLVATGHRTLALLFGVIVVINAILMYAWGQCVSGTHNASSPGRGRRMARKATWGRRWARCYSA